MSKKNPEIQFTKGDAYPIPFEVIDLDDNAFNISGAELAFTVRCKSTDPQSESIIEKTTGDGITIIGGGVSGEFEVKIDISDTVDEVARKYHCDVEMILGGEKNTIFNDFFEIVEDVTKP